MEILHVVYTVLRAIEKHFNRIISVVMVTMFLVIIYLQLQRKTDSTSVSVIKHYSTRYIKSEEFKVSSAAKSKGFNIVTHFMLLSNEIWRQNFTELFNESLVKERQDEIKESLDRNLNSEFISYVHVLLHEENAVDYLNNVQFKNPQKLVLHFLPKPFTYADHLRYINSHLVNRTVLLMNNDCYLGTGFEHVSEVILKSGVFYALTTRGKRERKCKFPDYCVEYVFHHSHDAFVFHLAKPIPEDFLLDLEYDPGIIGAPNILVGLFQFKLGFSCLDPCVLLQVFHNHCSQVRRVSEERAYVRGLIGNCDQPGYKLVQ